MDYTLTSQLERRKIKFIVLGEGGVGKTTLLQNYIQLSWKQKEEELVAKTKGVDLFVQKMNLDGDEFLVEFIDIEGELDQTGHFELFLQMFSDEPSDFPLNLPFHGIIFVFESTNKKSLSSMKTWIKWFHDSMKTIILNKSSQKHLLEKPNQSNPYEEFIKIPILFLGNKYDILCKETGGTLE